MVLCTLHRFLWLARNLVIQTQTSELLNGVFVFYNYIDFTAAQILMIDWLMLLKDEDIPEGDWMCIKCFAGHPDQKVQIIKKKDYFFLKFLY